MSILICDNCEAYIDTDFEPIFTHKNGKNYCEDCAMECGFNEPEDGEYSG